MPEHECECESHPGFVGHVVNGIETQAEATDPIRFLTTVAQTADGAHPVAACRLYRVALSHPVSPKNGKSGTLPNAEGLICLNKLTPNTVLRYWASSCSSTEYLNCGTEIPPERHLRSNELRELDCGETSRV